MSSETPASKEHGHISRMTRQRQAILQVLEQAKRPLSADEVLQLGRLLYPRLGERTVFRNLREMLNGFELVRLVYPGQPPRFELPSETHHPHVVCRDCGKLFDLEGETPDVISRYKAPPEFELEGEEVLFYGRCKIQNCPNRPLPADS